MNGKTAKYYKYKNTSGRIIISKNIADLLGWNHLEELNITLETINEKTGLFITNEKRVLEKNE